MSEAYNGYLDTVRRIEAANRRDWGLPPLKSDKESAIADIRNAARRAEQRQRAIETRAARDAERLPEERLRRSRTEWGLLVPPHIAAAQVTYEKHATMFAMKAAGIKTRAIARAFGLSVGHVQNLIRWHSWREPHRQEKSPVASYLSHPDIDPELAHAIHVGVLEMRYAAEAYFGA